MKFLFKKFLLLALIVIGVVSISGGLYYKLLYKTPEEKALTLVVMMFDNLKKNRDVTNMISEDLLQTLKTNELVYAMSDDTFFVENSLIKDANLVVIGRKGKLTTWQEHTQYFSIKKTGNEYKIDDSIDYVMHKNTWYQLAETPQNMTDNKITKMIELIWSGLKMEITDIEHPSYSPEWTKGTVRVTNNSDYDLQNVSLIVYNYDNGGVSISPDIVFISSIPKHGRAETPWTSMNCSECITHKVELHP